MVDGVMLISKKINDAINQQIGNEFGAFLQYVAIAAHFDEEALPQLAAHFYKQAEEERDHAMRFVKFLVETDGAVVIPAVKSPKNKFATAEEAVQLSLDWEVEVTQQIHKLVDLANARGGHDNVTVVIAGDGGMVHAGRADGHVDSGFLARRCPATRTSATRTSATRTSGLPARRSTVRT